MKYSFFTTRLRLVLMLLLPLVYMGCPYTDFYRLVIHKTEPRKHPFSGIGLVRDNPKDSIEIWYSNATNNFGVNEVLHSKFAADTVVGMNYSWINIDFGKDHGEEAIYYAKPDYTDKGGQYFKICNRGRGNLFYFIIPSPESYKPFNWELSNKNQIEVAPMNRVIIADYSTKKNIYDLVYPNGNYDKKGMYYVANQYKKHDKDTNSLYMLSAGKINSPETYTQDYNKLSVSKSFVYSENYDLGKVNNSKTFYYGVIYPNECLLNSKYTGGIMLQLNMGDVCYDEQGNIVFV